MVKCLLSDKSIRRQHVLKTNNLLFNNIFVGKSLKLFMNDILFVHTNNAQRICLVMESLQCRMYPIIPILIYKEMLSPRVKQTFFNNSKQMPNENTK